MENQTYQAKTPQQVQPPQYYPQHQLRQKPPMTKGQGTGIIVLLVFILIAVSITAIVSAINLAAFIAFGTAFGALGI